LDERLLLNLEARMAAPTISTLPARSVTASVWPEDFEQIPDEAWTHAPVDEFGLNYDAVGNHGWYKNLEPTIAQVVAALDVGKVLIDYSSGTGILTKRLLEKIDHEVGILNVDASPKFLRVALENFKDDERVAFRLLPYLKDQKRLRTVDEVIGQPMIDRGADILTATNAIHLYYDLPETLESWARVLKPGALALICSANMRNPNRHKGDWIIDETVAAVNEIAVDLVRREPAFAQYREALDDADRMAAYTQVREKVFVPVRDLAYYTDSFADAGFSVLHVTEATIFARVDEWSDLLCTYHEGVLSWVGGTERIDGRPPSVRAMLDRKFLIRASLERLFPGQDAFPATWTYLTCRH
jgi:ubiquinone/menaquinone biosynthesis C-methylase UbiE